MPARRVRRTLTLAVPGGGTLTTFLMRLGRALGAGDDEDALVRVAQIADIPMPTLVRALANGTLASLPTGAVRTLLTMARLLPGIPPVDINDLAPLDPAAVKLLLGSVRAP